MTSARPAVLIGGGLLGLALLGLLASRTAPARALLGTDDDDDGGDVSRLPPGPAREKRPGLLAGLTAPAQAAAARLDALAQAEGLPALTWTSGRRSTLEQAAAMLGKVARGEDLYALYRSARPTLDALMAASRTPAAWAEVLQRFPPLSRHLAGEGLDVRRWGFTPAELYRLGELAIAAGWGRALLESDHLHLQMP